MTGLEAHFPRGCWHQPDDTYAGECGCGFTFHGATLADAKAAWAAHVYTPRPVEGEVSDYRLGLERAAHECEWMARGYAAHLMQPLLDAGKRIREIPDNPADEPHCKRRDGQTPALARPVEAGAGKLAEVLWKRACVGREGYCSSDLQDAAKWAIGEAFRLAEAAARSAALPPNYQWSEGNREKFDFGRDSAADAIAALTTPAGGEKA